ncbi:unnamed protein product [Symbiodinium sp. KB8]|nr:unnamed protein product [Symbiodinium sp. KB8]
MSDEWLDLLGARWDKTLKYWSLDTGKCLRYSFRVLAQKGRLVDFERTTVDDKHASMITGPTTAGTFDGHENHVNWVCFSTDEKEFLSASSDRTSRCWRKKNIYNYHFVEAKQHVSGGRILAQSGFEGAHGFFAVADGPVYQDQKWHLMMQGDGAFVITNAKSGRRIWAVDEDRGGVSFGASPMLGSEGQSWWLIRQDIDESGLLRAELAAERRSKSMLLAKVEERDAKLEMFRREAEAGCPAAPPPQWHQSSDLGLLGAWTRTWAVDQTLSLYLLTGLLLLGLLNIHLNLQLQKERGSGQRKEVVPETPPAAATTPEDPGQGLGQDFGYHVLDTEVNGNSVRLIKIQCPGVEHEDVNVELLFNGCQVRLARRAACGIAAAAWAKRFEFPSQEGIFEFREDQMRLEHGFLHLVFRTHPFHSRRVRFPRHYMPP